MYETLNEGISLTNLILNWSAASTNDAAYNRVTHC